jgi:hypothetical protein
VGEVQLQYSDLYERVLFYRVYNNQFPYGTH